MTKHGVHANAPDEVMASKKNCRILVTTEPDSDLELKTNKIKQWSGS